MAGKKSVLMTGASGSVGKASIQALAGYADVLDVKAGVRSPSKPEAAELAKLGPNITVVAADPFTGDLKTAIEGVDYLYIVTPGHIDRTRIVQANVDAAKAAGVKFILLTSVLSADWTGTVFGDHFSPAEAHLKASGIPYAILRLPIFLDNNYGNIGSIKGQGTFYGAVGADKPAIYVATKDIGEVAAKILSDPVPYSNKTYPIGSKPSTPNDAAKAFSDVLGKPITYTKVPYEAVEDSLKSFMLDWQITGLVELFKGINDSNPVFVEPKGADNVEAILGRPPIGIKEWVTEAAPAFQ
eukprot:SM000017S02788  [mRNA]  locus=s17:189824:192017:- [translate_table: standard]